LHSYGYLFWDALLYSGGMSVGAIEAPNAAGNDWAAQPELVDDRSFNFRMGGLNTDFMSYSTIGLADDSKQALLDPTTYIENANRVFGTFFKHYASQDVNFSTGGQVYQTTGATLPSDIGGFIHPQIQPETHEKRDADSPSIIEATLHIPVEQLVMSPAAVWLCVAILAFLCLITVVIYALGRNRFKALPRDVDSLASVLGFVYASENLLKWICENKDSETWNQEGVRKKWRWRREKYDRSELKAMLGPFSTAHGEDKWGVEIVAKDKSLRKSIRGSDFDNDNIAIAPSVKGGAEISTRKAEHMRSRMKDGEGESIQLLQLRNSETTFNDEDVAEILGTRNHGRSDVE